MSDFTDTINPWWEKSHPTFVPILSRSDFYSLVTELRSTPYGSRVEKIKAMVGQHPVNLFEVSVEVMGLDKQAAGKFLRLLRLVKSFDDYRAKAPDAHKSMFDQVGTMLDAFSIDTLVEGIRSNLIPRRERFLSPAEQAGYNNLLAIEDERKKVLREYEAREAKLTEELRRLRVDRDEFGRQIASLIPPWRDIKSARDKSLTAQERTTLVARWETTADLQQRYTIEAYLSAARANKSQLAEKSVYESFLAVGSSDDCRGRVRRAESRANTQSPEIQGSDSPSAAPAVDEIAPN